MATGLTRWRPFGELEDLRSRMDRMFEDLMAEARGVRGGSEWSPAIDVHREAGRLVVRADVPGIKPEEIKVELEDDTLTVSGHHEETEEERGRDYERRERRYGTFRRSITVPRNVDPDQIRAVTRDGVLEITVPVPVRGKGATRVITPTAG